MANMKSHKGTLSFSKYVLVVSCCKLDDHREKEMATKLPMLRRFEDFQDFEIAARSTTPSPKHQKVIPHQYTHTHVCPQNNPLQIHNPISASRIFLRSRPFANLGENGVTRPLRGYSLGRCNLAPRFRSWRATLLAETKCKDRSAYLWWCLGKFTFAIRLKWMFQEHIQRP